VPRLDLLRLRDRAARAQSDTKLRAQKLPPINSVLRSDSLVAGATKMAFWALTFLAAFAVAVSAVAIFAPTLRSVVGGRNIRYSSNPIGVVILSSKGNYPTHFVRPSLDRVGLFIAVVGIIAAVAGMAVSIFASEARDALGLATDCVPTVCPAAAPMNFEGKVDTASVRMRLAVSGNKLTGEYYYRHIGANHTLRIFGDLEQNGDVVLREFNMQGDTTGHFFGRLHANTRLEGIFLRSDGKQSRFMLRRAEQR
jgi:hypothetical protein